MLCYVQEFSNISCFEMERGFQISTSLQKTLVEFFFVSRTRSSFCDTILVSDAYKYLPYALKEKTK